MMFTKQVLLFVLIGALCAPAQAAFHLWEMSELFSTPDGRVQAVELTTAYDGQQGLNGQTLRAVDTAAGTTNDFIFPSDSGFPTADTTLLIATPGFADLPGGVAPDFTIPRHFLPLQNGTIELLNANDPFLAYNALPLDGTSSLDDTNGVGPATLKNLAGDTATIDVPGVGDGRILWEGLYHSGAGLDPLTETIPEPAFAANTFIERDEDNGQLAVYFLTTSPAGEGSVSTRVRFYVGDGLNIEQFADGTFQTNVILNTSTQFHDTPDEGSVMLDLWKATWDVPHGFTGLVYYAPQVRLQDGGTETDALYLTRTVNTGDAASGMNAHFWQTNAQAFATSPIGIDYSVAWTNGIAPNFDLVYFNNTNAGLPQLEMVPGLGGTPFFDYSYDPMTPSYVYTLTEHLAVSSVRTRFYFTNGGGQALRDATFFSNVVLQAAQPFHGYPTTGSVTVDVWRTAFYPPAGWSGETLYYASEVTKPLDGAFWLVRNHDGIVGDTILTNNWPQNPQLLYSESAIGHDWAFTPTGPVSRAGITLDCAYHNNTNRNPQAEAVPSLGGTPFLDVRYADATTTFYLLTDSPANAVPGEDLSVQMRIDYDHPTNGFAPQTLPMTFARNVVISDTAPFHGLPDTGTKQLDLWKLDWPHPADTNGVPLTNQLDIFYAPVLRTTFGDDAYQTGEHYLLADSTSPESSSHPVDPQYAGPDVIGHDYRYTHAWTLASDYDGDGLSDAEELALGTNPFAADSDGDGAPDNHELAAGTNPTNSASVFSVTHALVDAATLNFEWLAVTGRTYTVQCASNGLPPEGTFNAIQTGISVPSSQIVTSTVPMGPLPRFYRILLEP